MTDADSTHASAPGDGFDVALEHNGDRAVIRCSGELDISSCERLESAIQAAAVPELVIDCSNLSFIDSTGVRTLLKASARLDKLGVRWSILPGDALRRVTSVLGVGPAFGLGDETGTA